MKRAHGTAQAVLTASMPPWRAEIVPEPGSLSRFRVRLWNLGNSTGDAVGYRLEQVELGSVRFGGAPVPRVLVAERIGEVVLPRASAWVSPPFSLNDAQQLALKFSSYSAVVVKARVGVDKPLDVSFAVPIPNGFPVVNQLTSTLVLDAASYATNSPANCCMTSCTACGETAEYAQGMVQDVTGNIRRYSSHLDSLGTQATGNTLRAIDADTRLAAVTLVSFGRTSLPLDSQPRAVRSMLTMQSPLFEKRGDTYVRRADAPDQPDPAQFDFSIRLDARDFFTDAVDSYRATQTVYLVVWMTSGAMYIQNLALWPIRRPDAVSVALAGEECDQVNVWRDLQYERVSGCLSTRSGEPMCSEGTYTATTRTVIHGPLRGFAIPYSWPLSLSSNLKILRLAGIDASTLGQQCTNPTVGENLSFRCFDDLNSFIVDNRVVRGSGACPGIPPPPTLPRTATMRPEWKPDFKAQLKQVFGRDDEPTFQDVELR